MRRAGVLLGLSLLSVSACHGPSWKTTLLANPNQVARALNDPVEIGPKEAFDPMALPVFDPPKTVRPCCPFGMDLKVQVGAVRVPGYEKGNIVSTKDLGSHGYDDGSMINDKNGLIYTCRGGFIDTAHIRDNADRTVYLAMQLLRALPAGVTIDLPEEGTKRRVIVKPLPRELMSRYERWNTATALAGWIDYQLSIWHEVVTWYGWESVKGFSEKLSAFSPEDLYSNVLGMRLAMGVIINREVQTREEYNKAMDAWILEGLRRLGAVRAEDSRQVMRSLDGLWWNSHKALPDWKIVTRRNLSISTPLRPWLASDAVPEKNLDPALSRMCSKKLPRLELDVPQRLGDKKIEDLVQIEFEFSGWVPDRFAMPVQKGKVVTVSDFPAILEDIRREGTRELGPGFDKPLTLGEEQRVAARLPTSLASSPACF